MAESKSTNSFALARELGLTVDQYFDLGSAIRNEAADELRREQRKLSLARRLNGKTATGFSYAIQVLRRNTVS